jgi:hypothetical protein
MLLIVVPTADTWQNAAQLRPDDLRPKLINYSESRSGNFNRTSQLFGRISQREQENPTWY